MAMKNAVMMAGISVLTCALVAAPAWADPDKKYGGHGEKSYGGHGDGYGRGGHGMGAAMMEMIATTINSSISVNPRSLFVLMAPSIDTCAGASFPTWSRWMPIARVSVVRP